MRLAPVLFLLASVPLCAQSWTLRHLPGSATYELTSTDTVKVESQGRVTERSTPVRRLVTRTLSPAPGGLAVEQAERELAIGVGTGTMTMGPLQPPARFSVRGTGEGAGSGPALELLLPTGTVSPGARWETVAPATARAPLPLKTRWHLERVETVAGRTCAIIAATVAGESFVPPRGAKVTHEGKLRLAFDPRAGLIVRALAEATTVVEEPPDPKGRPRRKTTRLTSALTLR